MIQVIVKVRTQECGTNAQDKLSHLINTYGFGHTASSYRVCEFSSNTASSVQAEQSAESSSHSYIHSECIPQIFYVS